jgi:hypothetical protein
MTAKPDVATLVRELRATLDHIGDALVNGRYDDLITTESRLAGVVSGFTASFPGSFTDGPSVGSTIPRPPVADIDDALTALRRCQRLGANLHELSTPWLVAGNPAAGAYDRSGHAHGQRYGQSPSTTLQTRA